MSICVDDSNQCKARSICICCLYDFCVVTFVPYHVWIFFLLDFKFCTGFPHLTLIFVDTAPIFAIFWLIIYVLRQYDHVNRRRQTYSSCWWRRRATLPQTSSIRSISNYSCNIVDTKRNKHYNSQSKSINNQRIRIQRCQQNPNLRNWSGTNETRIMDRYDIQQPSIIFRSTSSICKHRKIN